MSRFWGLIIFFLTCVLITVPSVHICEHDDLNTDHDCDYCYETLSECEDADKDHICDYGCGKSVGDCADANKDHVCDYNCGQAFGDCVDNDKNHACDYGCGATFGDHADADLDHACDYGCTVQDFGACEDANKDGYCDYGCGKLFEIDDTPAYTREGDYIYFGEYPQTLKAEGVTVTSSQDSRGYYLGSDGCYYARVTATPYESGYKFSTGASVRRGTTYYFKVEPIRWRILSEDGETALILCDSIIANMTYDAGYNNNYEDSNIRARLNDQFYKTAFGDLQRDVILTTTVDNSAASTGESSNSYACANTEDKIFLLSYKEVTNSAYGFASSAGTEDEARRMLTSDYARATGVAMSISSNTYGNGDWWLRSPFTYYSNYARIVLYDGNAADYNYVNFSGHGVVPALQIRL